MKKDKGITLIALVITIIVLLILAGVSISLVVGENGIIGRSINSREKTKYAEAYERVYTEVDGSYDESGTINLDDLNKNLRENLDGVKLKIGEDNYADLTEENKIESLPATVRYNGYDFDIEGTSTTNPTTPGGETATPGEKIVPTISGYTEFCSDSNNKYYIYNGYYETSKLITTGTIAKTGDYCVYSTSNREDLLNYLKGEGTYSTVWDSIKEEVKNSLISQGIPESVASTIKVTGAPTLKQVEDAYNSKYWKDTANDKKLTSQMQGSDGYYYSYQKVGEESYNASIHNAKLPDTFLNDKLFFPVRGATGLGDCQGYWIADYSGGTAGDKTRYLCALYEGLGAQTYDYTKLAARPVVTLPNAVFEQTQK